MDIKDIVQRLRKGESIKAIHRELGKHKTVIRKVKRIAEEEGWLDALSPLPPENELRDAYQTAEEGSSPHPLDAIQEDIKRWLDEDYSFVVIHTLAQETVPCSESTVRRYIYRHFPSTPRLVMRRFTVAGEVMEVDFGHLGVCWDPVTRSRRKTWFFSARLRHSRRAYREVVFDQRQETFFACHVHAFAYFGGVPRKVAPDNLKAAIIKASWQDPLVNRSYRDLAEHYGFLISPCLPYHPQHHGGVESDVKYVKRNFLPLFKEHQRQRGQEVLNAAALREELERWNRETCDQRVIQKVGRTPQEIFCREEASALGKLPVTPWDPKRYQEAVVGTDWRIQFEKAFYSVPYALVGKKVLVMASSRLVRIFSQEREVALHRRALKDWDYRRRKEHAPPHQEAYLHLTSQGLLRQARHIGPATTTVAERILADKAVDGLRPLRGLLRLAEKYPTSRLEAACRRALAYETTTYRSVKSILHHGLDRVEDTQRQPEPLPAQFRFQRSYGYFDPAHSESGERSS